MVQKAELEREKKAMVDAAAEKEAALRAKIKTIGNLVHDSVPVSNNEVSNKNSTRNVQTTGSLP